MSRSLDFNAIERPTLDVTMRDEARTVLHVSAPTEAFVEEMEALAPTITKMKTGGNTHELFAKMFEFFAKILSYNEEGLKVTAKDLRDVYKLTLVDLFALYGEYMAFIEELQSAKN